MNGFDRGSVKPGDAARGRPIVEGKGGCLRCHRISGTGSRVAQLAYLVRGEQIAQARCDGLVVSTPVGSTGYNLANGGPVVAWGVEGYVVSYIAPHWGRGRNDDDHRARRQPAYPRRPF